MLIQMRRKMILWGKYYIKLLQRRNPQLELPYCSNFSLRLQPHSPIKPEWSDLRDLNFDCIQFSGFRTQWCNARSSLRCPCTIDWQFSRPAQLIFPSGAYRPIENIRTRRMWVETIFEGLLCRCSLTVTTPYCSLQIPKFFLRCWFRWDGKWSSKVNITLNCNKEETHRL